MSTTTRPFLGRWLHVCTDGELLDEFDGAAFLACRCFHSADFLEAQDRVAVVLDAERTPKSSEVQQVSHVFRAALWLETEGRSTAVPILETCYCEPEQAAPWDDRTTKPAAEITVREDMPVDTQLDIADLLIAMARVQAHPTMAELQGFAEFLRRGRDS